MPHLVTTFDMGPTKRRYGHATRLVRAHTRRRLSYWGRYIISSIRKDHRIFKYAGGGSRSKGTLQASLWTRRGRGAEPVQQMGWGVPYGEVLEFGPKGAHEWIITPKGFRSDVNLGRSGGGQALKFLRFEVGGKVVYARKVVHRWTRAELRPHFGPHIKKHRRGFMADMGSICKRVLDGTLR